MVWLCLFRAINEREFTKLVKGGSVRQTTCKPVSLFRVNYFLVEINANGSFTAYQQLVAVTTVEVPHKKALYKEQARLIRAMKAMQMISRPS